MTCKHCKQTAEHLGPVGMWQHCPDHEGGSLTHEWVEARTPDPCPACGKHGHAMAPESGPGPLCSPLRDVTGDFEGATYYDCEDSEHLSYTDPDEAIGYALDALDEDPAELEIVAYKSVVLDLDAIAEHVLELALERLDEVLGDPGGDPCEPTPAMQEAARAFAAAISAEYQPWQCEPCGRATVDVATWRKVEDIEHRARMAELHAAALAVVKTGHCPDCGASIHRNSSLAGWWQCDRSGSGSFRRDQTGAHCTWQTFTE